MDCRDAWHPLFASDACFGSDPFGALRIQLGGLICSCFGNEMLTSIMLLIACAAVIGFSSSSRFAWANGTTVDGEMPCRRQRAESSDMSVSDCRDVQNRI